MDRLVEWWVGLGAGQEPRMTTLLIDDELGA
jgi:hypothetical protein